MGSLCNGAGSSVTTWHAMAPKAAKGKPRKSIPAGQAKAKAKSSTPQHTSFGVVVSEPYLSRYSQGKVAEVHRMRCTLHAGVDVFIFEAMPGDSNVLKLRFKAEFKENRTIPRNLFGSFAGSHKMTVDEMNKELPSGTVHLWCFQNVDAVDASVPRFMTAELKGTNRVVRFNAKDCH